MATKIIIILCVVLLLGSYIAYNEIVKHNLRDENKKLTTQNKSFQEQAEYNKKMLAEEAKKKEELQRKINAIYNPNITTNRLINDANALFMQ